MPPDERDLTPLDPELDPPRWEGMVGSILAAAQPELERRAIVRNPLLLLTDWFKPTMAASAAIAGFAASAVLFLGSGSSEIAAPTGIVAEGIGIPSAIASWLDTGQAEALDELVFQIEGETQ